MLPFWLVASALCVILLIDVALLPTVAVLHFTCPCVLLELGTLAWFILSKAAWFALLNSNQAPQRPE